MVEKKSNQLKDFFIFLKYCFLTDALPEGLTHELPTADEFQKQAIPETTFDSIDDLDDLRKQLEALNAE